MPPIGLTAPPPGFHSARRGLDPEDPRRLDPVVNGVLKADFGTSLIYWKKGYKPQEFNGWAHSQLGRTLVALYQGTGDKRVLDALVKVYAELCHAHVDGNRR